MKYVLSLVNSNNIKTHLHDSRWIRITKTKSTRPFLSPMFTSTRRIQSSPLFSSQPLVGRRLALLLQLLLLLHFPNAFGSRVALLGILVFVTGYRWGSLMMTTKPSCSTILNDHRRDTNVSTRGIHPSRWLENDPARGQTQV